MEEETKIKVKIQEKTQDMREPQEKHQDKYKKNFSKKILNSTICPEKISKKNLLPEFLLSGNRLP